MQFQFKKLPRAEADLNCRALKRKKIIKVAGLGELIHYRQAPGLARNSLAQVANVPFSNS